MKVLAKIAFILIVTLFLGGCTAKGPSFSELAPSINELPSNAGRIYLYRTTIFGAAYQPEVKINNEVVGKSIARGFFYVDKEPGNYEIMTSYEVDGKLSLVLEEGQTRYVRFGASMIGLNYIIIHVHPELVSSEVGHEEIQNCKYTGDQPKSN